MPYIKDLLLVKEVTQRVVEQATKDTFNIKASIDLDGSLLAWRFDFTVHPQSRAMIDLLVHQPIFGTINSYEHTIEILKMKIREHERVLDEYNGQLTLLSVKDLRSYFN
jgi:hypothetical protein